MSQNFNEKIAARKDIFDIEDDRRLIGTNTIAVILGIILSLFLRTIEIADVAADFFEKLPQEISGTIVVEEAKIEEKKEEKKEKKKEKEKVKKDLKQQKVKGSGGGVGKGDIRQRVTHKGLLAVLSGKVKGRATVGGNFMGQNFAKDLDAVLDQIGGLKTSGKAALGRMGAAGGKFNAGYAGGGSGGIDDLLGGLAGRAEQVKLVKKAKIKLADLKHIGVGGMSGARSPESIAKVVRQHIGALRHAYNKRLRDKPGLKGKVSVRFTISPPGRVVAVKMVSSTMNDSTLENEILRRIRSWRFDQIEPDAGDVTVTYPFAFTQ